MGMFDWVNYKMPCPECGKEVTGFQTKDTSCELKTVEFWECDNFYTSCDYCDIWIEFYLNEKRPFVPIENYRMEVRKSGLSESQLTRDKDGKINGKIIGFSGK